MRKQEQAQRDFESGGDLSAAEFRDGSVIRKVCESPPLSHEQQREHLVIIRRGILAVRAEVAQFPPILDDLLQHEFSGAEFSQRRQLEDARAQTQALWRRRGEASWEGRYAERLAQNSELALKAFEELFDISERPYAEIKEMENRVRELCRGASSFDTGIPEERQAEYRDRYEALAKRPFEDILRSSRIIDSCEREIAPSKQVMVESNLRLVARAVGSFKSRVGSHGIDAPGSLDLFQEGVFGLIAALERFRPELGFRFSTYALHWINQAIGKSNEADALIALPHQVRQLVSWERKVREKLTREQGIEPGEEEVIARMELSAREEEALRRGKRAFIDSSRTTAESSEIDFMESLPGDPGVEIQRLDAAEARSRVGRALERLFEGKFRTVMERRFSSVGSEGRSGRPSTLAAIGKDLSLCRERISQLERAGVELLTNYFIVETALPSVRAKVQQRVLGPEDEKVMINLIGAHYEELCDKRRQAEVLQRSAAGVVIVELGEAGWKTLASARGLAPARAFVVGDRLFGREPCFFEVARRAVSTGMVTDKWFNATDAETLFFRTLRQMGPALREEFRRRRSQLF